MKLSSIVVAAAFVIMFGAARCPAAEPLDGVAAVVNKDVITFAQVREVTAPEAARARRELTGDALQVKLKEIRQKGLNDLIERKRAEQGAKKAK